MEFLGPILLIVLGVVIVFGFHFFNQVKAKKDEAEINKMRSSIAIRCPGCRADIGEKLQKERHKDENAYKQEINYKCSCGRISHWDVVGNPPVLKDEAELKISDLRKDIKGGTPR